MRRTLFIFFMAFFFSQTSFGADKSFFRADYGAGMFTSEKLDALNTNPVGTTFGAAFGSRLNYIEFGMMFRKSSFKSDINHDGASNKLIHSGITFGLDFSVFVNNYLSLKVGYALHKYEQKLETNVSALAMAAIRTTYGLEEDARTTNAYFGANIDFFPQNKYDLYLSATQFPMGDGKSSTTVQFGLKIYMNSTLGSLFSGAK